MLNSPQSPGLKRLIDLLVAVPVSIASFPLCVLLIAAATVDTRQFGLFTQTRVGRGGEEFTVYKIRSMRATSDTSTVTVAGDMRVTTFGAFMRRMKLDEIPQFWNVALGQMSLVGPRPDVPGYADALTADDRVILDLRPGITGPATLLFRNEETFLAIQPDPVTANDTIVWPTKVLINRKYQQHGSLRNDLAMLDMTLRGSDHRLKDMFASWDQASLLSHPTVTELLELENKS